jgi:hypothetical protein
MAIPNSRTFSVDRLIVKAAPRKMTTRAITASPRSLGFRSSRVFLFDGSKKKMVFPASMHLT